MYDALPVMFDHQWCGVTQLGWDEKSAHKIAQMLALNLPPDIACAVTAELVAGPDRRRYRLRRHHLSGRRLAVPAAAHRRAAGAGGHARTARALWLSRRNAQRGGRWLAAQSAALSSGGGSGERPPHHWFCAKPPQLPSTRFGGQVSHIPTTPRACRPAPGAVLRRLPDATESAKSAALHWRQLPPRENRHQLQAKKISSTTGNG
ncbi:5-methylaminomethyl-2-thiouridine methyltransferase [Klebsiella pneumoniae subsp. ozaenae]|uniref:5-methylaminomethyl-2-thiouridine methyltransferase n=1 Tax=Klebsiella pneumoniae subsp. ozaenae TaxID=574 RepID=A0A377ZC36_KLEPO|nr:5-methylaminomethyl-2-thiouridine methyltransferase [Klebsiella pneumoniae subsp. ozaenae]